MPTPADDFAWWLLGPRDCDDDYGIDDITDPDVIEALELYDKWMGEED